MAQFAATIATMKRVFPWLAVTGMILFPVSCLDGTQEDAGAPGERPPSSQSDAGTIWDGGPLADAGHSITDASIVLDSGPHASDSGLGSIDAGSQSDGGPPAANDSGTLWHDGGISHPDGGHDAMDGGLITPDAGWLDGGPIASDSGPHHGADAGSSGCALLGGNAYCDDGNVCNGAEQCDPLSDTCQSGNALICVDGDPCTKDHHCVPGYGCLYLPACDDGNPCTSDICDADAGAGSSGLCTHPDKCNDGKFCTVDTCDSITGECTFKTELGEDHPICGDGNLCTVDVCLPADGGSCARSDLECPEADPCSEEGICDLSTGECGYAPLDCVAELEARYANWDYDPDNLCEQVYCKLNQTQGGACPGTGCCLEDGMIDSPGSPWDGTGFCNDWNPCTLDTCEPATGCNSVGDVTAQPSWSCNDSNACTMEQCSEEGECIHVPIDDSDLCTRQVSCNTSTGDIVYEESCLPTDACSEGICDAVAGTCTYTYPALGQCCNDVLYESTNTFSTPQEKSAYLPCTFSGGQTGFHVSETRSNTWPASLHFGNPNGGYAHSEDPDLPVKGSTLSHVLTVPESQFLTLEFWASTHVPETLDQDIFSLSIRSSEPGVGGLAYCTGDGEPAGDLVWEKSANNTSGFAGNFRKYEIELFDYRGKDIMLEWHFDSVDPVPEGYWQGLFIDDIVLRRACPSEPCQSEAECDDNNPCTNDSCVDFGCRHAKSVCNDGLDCTIDRCVVNAENQAECSADYPQCPDFNFCFLPEFDGDGCCTYTPRTQVDGIDIDDENPCNGVERCNALTEEIESSPAIECDDGTACNGIETCHPETGDCLDGDEIICDDDGDICTGTLACKEPTGECDYSVLSPVPLDDDFMCPESPAECTTGFSSPVGETPNNELEEIDDRGFVLRDTNTWDEREAILNELAIAPGVVGRVSLNVLLGNLNRNTADTAAWLISRPACLNDGFTWNVSDFTTEPWWPQGISGTSDAYGFDPPDSRRHIVASSYHKEDDASKNKGARVSFFDITDDDSIHYRHALLVKPIRLEDGTPSFESINTHAGGIVWFQNYIYVAQTGSGLRVFDLDQIIEVNTGGSESFLGIDGNGDYRAYNYRYVIPEVSRYKRCDTCCCARFSFVGMDRSEMGLVTGEYTGADDDGRLIKWWLDEDTGRLRDFNDDGLITPYTAYFHGLRGAQGAVSYQGRYWVSSNYEEGGSIHTGYLYTGRPDESLVGHGHTFGTEDLYYSIYDDYIWGLGEMPANRYIFNMDADELVYDYPDGCFWFDLDLPDWEWPWEWLD
jgi:hypothetical protein